MPRLVTTVLRHQTVGTAPGSIPLIATGWAPPAQEKAPLERLLDPLPELDQDIATRPLRRQPAFIVSLVIAIIAMLIVGGFWAKKQFWSPPDAVQGITVLDGGTNWVLEWRGPDVPYTVFVVHQDGVVQGDVSMWIREWRVSMPKSYSKLAADSCFVVAPEATFDRLATIDLDRIGASGGSFVCIADAISDTE